MSIPTPGRGPTMVILVAGSLAILTARLTAQEVADLTAPAASRTGQSLVPTSSAVGPHESTPFPIPHGDHGEFSKYLIDPVFTHHAILEDELRVNTFMDVRDGRNIWRTSLEVAYALTDAIGVEVFLPATASEIPGLGGMGLGDIEVQALKWSFLRSEKLIMTAALGGVLPTGDADRGMGEGVWVVEPHLFTDAVIRSFAVQVNGAYGFVEGGEQEVEFSTSVARMLFLSDEVEVGPLVEFMGTLVTRGQAAGDWARLGVAPGVKLAVRGWHFGVGVRTPLVDADPSDLLVVWTGGYHVAF